MRACRVLDSDLDGGYKSILRSKGETARLLKGLTRTLDGHGLDWNDLDAFQDVRDDLCELDVRYSQLYPRGIFLELEKAEEIRDGILVAGQIEAAIDQAPAEGRARVSRFVGLVDTYMLENIVIDNYLFGVASVSKDGYESPVVFPGPTGSFGE